MPTDRGTEPTLRVRRPLTLVAVFSLGCWACAAAAYLWVDRSLQKVTW